MTKKKLIRIETDSYFTDALVEITFKYVRYAFEHDFGIREVFELEPKSVEILSLENPETKAKVDLTADLENLIKNAALAQSD